MPKRMTKRQREMKAGILGFVGLLFLVGIFVIFMTLIPSMIGTIATTLAISDDVAMWLLLGIFFVGFLVVSFMSYNVMKR
jgi:hypothetical protein